MSWELNISWTDTVFGISISKLIRNKYWICLADITQNSVISAGSRLSKMTLSAWAALIIVELYLIIIVVFYVFTSCPENSTGLQPVQTQTLAFHKDPYGSVGVESVLTVGPSNQRMTVVCVAFNLVGQGSDTFAMDVSGKQMLQTVLFKNTSWSPWCIDHVSVFLSQISSSPALCVDL